MSCTLHIPLLQAVHTGMIEHDSNNIMYSFALLFAGLVPLYTGGQAAG